MIPVLKIYNLSLRVGRWPMQAISNALAGHHVLLLAHWHPYTEANLLYKKTEQKISSKADFFQILKILLQIYT